MALNFPPSDASPWTAPNGVIYTWNTDGYWEAKADPNDFDTDYLRLNATNDPVTGNLALDQDLAVGDNLAVTGTSAFTGLTTHEAGVSVTGTGSTNGIISADNSNGTDSNIKFGQHFITCEIAPSPSAGNTYGLVGVFKGKNIDNSSVSTQKTLRSVTGRFTEFNYPATATPIYNYFAIDCRGTGTGYAQIQTGSSTNSEVRGFFAPQSLGATPYKTYGFYSELNIDKPSAIDANAVNYNFYAKGTAPNYFKGGIQFENAGGNAGTTVNGDTLNRYEEGSWTAVIGGDGTINGVTPSDISSTYRVIGALVHVRLKITIPNTNEINLNNSVFSVTGMPFNAENLSQCVGCFGDGATNKGIVIVNTRNDIMRMKLVTQGDGTGSVSWISTDMTYTIG